MQVDIEYCEEEGQEKGEDPIFEFNFGKAPGNHIQVILSDNSVIEKGELNNLLKAYKAKLPYKISYCNSNGVVSMSTSNGRLDFCVSKHGAGGGADIKVSIGDDCTEVLEKIAKVW